MEFCDLYLTILGKEVLDLICKEFVERLEGLLSDFSLALVLLLVFEDIPLDLDWGGCGIGGFLEEVSFEEASGERSNLTFLWI